MDQPSSPRWRNCALTADAEIIEIDAMEDELAPLAPWVEEVRELISALELCHHKAGRWVENIVRAIGEGRTDKGLGTRPPGSFHDAERVWTAACEALETWCAGCPADQIEGSVGEVAASTLVARLGDRTALKEWQGQRVIERIRSLIHWPPASDDPSAGFTWILFSNDETGPTYLDECPGRFAEHEDYWRSTARTIIRDTQDGRESRLSLGLAIDMLWPCHWDFTANLEIVLSAIGGDLDPARPYAACGRNIGLLRNREVFESISRSLQSFRAGSEPGGDGDSTVFSLLGARTSEKSWLAASLDKTIRLQLDPTPELLALFDFSGPAWIHDARSEVGPG